MSTPILNLTETVLHQLRKDAIEPQPGYLQQPIVQSKDRGNIFPKNVT